MAYRKIYDLAKNQTPVIKPVYTQLINWAIQSHILH